jgi:hypothetical protein
MQKAEPSVPGHLTPVMVPADGHKGYYFGKRN